MIKYGIQFSLKWSSLVNMLLGMLPLLVVKFRSAKTTLSNSLYRFQRTQSFQNFQFYLLSKYERANFNLGKVITIHILPYQGCVIFFRKDLQNSFCLDFYKTTKLVHKTYKITRNNPIFVISQNK